MENLLSFYEYDLDSGSILNLSWRSLKDDAGSRPAMNAPGDMTESSDSDPLWFIIQEDLF